MSEKSEKSEKKWECDQGNLAEQLSFVAVDLETTGLDPKKDRIIEIGAIRVENGEVAGEYQQLVNPGCPIPDFVSDLTGITDEMVEKAPMIGEVLDEFLKFCGELPIVGHQVMFDYRFLKRATVNQGESFERNGIDTLALCRAFMPVEEKKNGVLVINPGSLSFPRQEGRRPSYAVMELHKGEEPEIEIRYL